MRLVGVVPVVRVTGVLVATATIGTVPIGRSLACSVARLPVVFCVSVIVVASPTVVVIITAPPVLVVVVARLPVVFCVSVFVVASPTVVAIIIAPSVVIIVVATLPVVVVVVIASHRASVPCRAKPVLLSILVAAPSGAVTAVTTWIVVAFASIVSILLVRRRSSISGSR